MSDRIFAIAWLVVCLTIAVQMYGLDVPFAYEPVGPRVFPFVLAVLMAACCAVLILRPDSDVEWPSRAVLTKSTILIAALLLYALLFTQLGFPFSTIVMVLIVSRLFGAGWKAASVSAVLIGLLGFFLFDRVLDVALPIGRVWS